MKKTCPYCGSPIEHDAAKCDYCNRVIEADAGVPAFVRDIQGHASLPEKMPAESAADNKPAIAKGMGDILSKRRTHREHKKDEPEENCFVFADANALDGLTVCGFTGAYPAELVIPALHKGKPVVEIGREAFKEMPVSRVVIPASVQAIGEAAFINCALLYEVEDGTGIRTIGEDAFKGCCLLNRFPALKSGGIHACYSSFAGCYQLSLDAESAFGFT